MSSDHRSALLASEKAMDISEVAGIKLSYCYEKEHLACTTHILCSDEGDKPKVISFENLCTPAHVD